MSPAHTTMASLRARVLHCGAAGRVRLLCVLDGEVLELRAPKAWQPGALLDVAAQLHHDEAGRVVDGVLLDAAPVVVDGDAVAAWRSWAPTFRERWAGVEDLEAEIRTMRGSDDADR